MPCCGCSDEPEPEIPQAPPRQSSGRRVARHQQSTRLAIGGSRSGRLPPTRSGRLVNVQQANTSIYDYLHTALQGEAEKILELSRFDPATLAQLLATYVRRVLAGGERLLTPLEIEKLFMVDLQSEVSAKHQGERCAPVGARVCQHLVVQYPDAMATLLKALEVQDDPPRQDEMYQMAMPIQHFVMQEVSRRVLVLPLASGPANAADIVRALGVHHMNLERQKLPLPTEAQQMLEKADYETRQLRRFLNCDLPPQISDRFSPVNHAKQVVHALKQAFLNGTCTWNMVSAISQQYREALAVRHMFTKGDALDVDTTLLKEYVCARGRINLIQCVVYNCPRVPEGNGVLAVVMINQGWDVCAQCCDTGEDCTGKNGNPQAAPCTKAKAEVDPMDDAWNGTALVEPLFWQVVCTELAQDGVASAFGMLVNFHQFTSGFMRTKYTEVDFNHPTNNTVVYSAVTVAVHNEMIASTERAVHCLRNTLGLNAPQNLQNTPWDPSMTLDNLQRGRGPAGMADALVVYGMLGLYRRNAEAAHSSTRDFILAMNLDNAGLW